MAQVAFIGAGPGDPELITVKGRRLIAEADLVLYAGSLVPAEVVACARPDADVIDSSPLDLQATHQLVRRAVRAGGAVARVHTGDPSLYGAVREQIELLDADGITWEIVPGVTAAFAAAACAGRSFTVPGAVQSLTITRLAGRTPVPEDEQLRDLAAHGCSLAIYLSAGDVEGVRRELLAGGLAPGTLVVAAHQVGWPGQTIVETTVEHMARTAEEHQMTRQTVFLILPGEAAGSARSKLYDEHFAHGFRPARPGSEEK